MVSLVYFDRGSYTDNYDGEVSLVDAVYYATVTISTTGYGDITPVRAHARIVNAIVVTPLRVLFLVLLVGTTLEVLANQGGGSSWTHAGGSGCAITSWWSASAPKAAVRSTPWRSAG